MRVRASVRSFGLRPASTRFYLSSHRFIFLHSWVYTNLRGSRGKGDSESEAGSGELPLAVERHLPAAGQVAMMKIYPCIQETWQLTRHARVSHDSYVTKQAYPPRLYLFLLRGIESRQSNWSEPALE